MKMPKKKSRPAKKLPADLAKFRDTYVKLFGTLPRPRARIAAALLAAGILVLASNPILDTYDGYRVLTNKPVCGAMRGHGTVNVRFAFESQLDELAAKIGMDSAEIRQRNLLQPPCITVNGLRVQSYGLPECIEKTVERSGWKQRGTCRQTRQGKPRPQLSNFCPVLRSHRCCRMAATRASTFSNCASAIFDPRMAFSIV